MEPLVWLGKKLLHGADGLISYGSAVPAAPFLEPAILPWTARLEANWTSIRTEVDSLLADLHKIPSLESISTHQRRLTSDSRWKTFFLFGYGFRVEQNCARCPNTTRLIETIPGLSTAFFSILLGGKRLAPHRGLYKGFLRYHLGVVVPEPAACGIRVANEVRHWEEGKSLLFDDTFEHEAWNNGVLPRVVLFMNIVRPMRRPFSWANNALISLITLSPYVRDARRNQHRFIADSHRPKGW